MRIPLVNLDTQYQELRTEILSSIEQVLEKGQYILGEQVNLLEQEIAQLCKVPYGIGVGNGTDALILILHALGVGSGDEVITTPFTFFATAEAIMRVGAMPVFADVDPNTCNLDPREIEKKITSRTKAILPVHLFGQMADMPKISELAEIHGLYVIEDACQAIGAKLDGHSVGYWGDAAAFSFFPTKNLGTYGDGGMIVSSLRQLDDSIRRLRVHGSKQKYVHEALGWNSRLDEIHAAILRVKLKRLAEWTKQRRQIAETYNKAFANLPIQLPLTPPENYHVYHLYTIVTDKRDELLNKLQSQGIGSGVYYPIPLHLQTALRGLGYKPGDFPIAEYLSAHSLSLPLFPGLKPTDAEAVIQQVESFFRG